MGGYRNGEWPESMFIEIASGRDGDGDWKHLTTAGTLQKHKRLVQLAFERTGRWLQISSGWSIYRPLAAQEHYRQIYGMRASEPGKSSHGLNWYDGDRGWRVCLAIDYHNWEWVYGGDQDAWYADVRAAGMEPGLIAKWRGNGYPDEPWHVIDLDPFRPVEPDVTEATVTEIENTLGANMKDMTLIRWNESHVFAIGRECIYHVPNPTQLATTMTLLKQSTLEEVDNGGLTLALMLSGLPWEPVDAVLRGAAFGANGRYWSRQIAEGEANRIGQARITKTLDDVIATAIEIRHA